MLTTDPAICIHFCIPKDPLVIPGSHSYYAEELCLQAAEQCNISPAATHLFGLFSSDQDLWFPPSAKIKAKDRVLNFYFRLRFKPYSLEKYDKEPGALNYYYHQMRQDFLSGRVTELHHSKVQSRTLGLVVTDVARHLIEQGQSPQDGSYSFSDFMPTSLTNPWKMRVLKPRMVHALHECWQNSRQNVQRIKEIYVSEFTALVPDYGCEQFEAQIDTDGRVWEVLLQVHPYHQLPGLRIRRKSSKENAAWSQICSISDLCFINTIPSNLTVEISRRNGIPQNLKFSSLNTMHAFVSLLDGYYRLTEKWTVNLCMNLITPSLTRLHSLRCHGPVGAKFAYQKLSEKGKNKPGCYLLRQSCTAHGEFRLDFLNANGQPETFRIRQAEDGGFGLVGNTETFPSLIRLVKDGLQPVLDVELNYCLPPSEYDKTDLRLCRPPGNETANVTRHKVSRQCFHDDDIVFTDNLADEFSGHFTLVRKGYLDTEGKDYKEVAVRMLKQRFVNTHLKEFLMQRDRMLFLQSECVVATIGIVVSPDYFGSLLEFLPLGRFDRYLAQYRYMLQPVDLVEAAKHLAKALWYLEEQGCIHGKIRCKYIMVSQHDENSFHVKLSSPSIITYTDDDVHWIPPEFHYDYNMAKTSLKADVWAFGTTVWEIFNTEDTFMDGASATLAKQKYKQGERLRIPQDAHESIKVLLKECWMTDPDSRPQPQTIMRDINQIFYEVYNSRRTHSYASVYPHADGPPLDSSLQESPSPQLDREKPDIISHSRNSGSPLLGADPLSIRRGFKKGKSLFRLRSTEVSYDNLSSCSTSTVQSESTLQSDLGTCIDVESLISLEETSSNIIALGSTSPLTDVSGSPWVIDSQQLVKGKPLGQGFFGEVYAASFKKWAGLKEETVAVKCMRKTSLLESLQTDSGFRDLQREIEIMKNLRHPNIVEIKGLVEEPEMMLVMEYVEMGSLLTYLQSFKSKITHPQLLKYSEDIANGMQYLEDKQIVHRDLAARNILVASDDCVKISDFGLAQFTVNHYYYIKTQNRKLPMKWYAPESILYGKFSTKSDVWSYGVTLWEMFSYGQDPALPDVPQEALGEKLSSGTRLPCPSECPFKVYHLMLRCWASNAHERPAFSEIRSFLDDL
uniref:Tyrosine-protein kinase n=1 Tax=Ornithodoros turicata TaxID=34597 RepID=A0A2R5LF78_9ACAR